MVSNEARNVGKDVTPVYRPLSQTLRWTVIILHTAQIISQRTKWLFCCITWWSNQQSVVLRSFLRLLRHSLSSQPTRAYVKHLHLLFRGTQRQFLENICSEDDLRSRIFGNICCKISCLPASPRIFEHLKIGIISHF